MIKFLKQLIVQAGKISIDEQTTLRPSDVDFKNKKDLVTRIDKKIEDFIIQKIHATYPDHGVLGEETGQTNTNSAYLWIIDPIDGTTSYFHQQPFFCVSIALHYLGKAVCSSVYIPALNELFYATKNGSFLNDKPIHMSDTGQLINSVMATGFACLRSDLRVNNLPYFNQMVPQIRDIRRYGSAAIDLCYVACGRFDAFWELNLNNYDIAAGAMIVQMAGGVVSDFKGSGEYPEQGIIAANPLLHGKILKEFDIVRSQQDDPLQ